MKILQVSTVSNTIRAFLCDYADAFRAIGWRVDAAAHSATNDEKIQRSHSAVYDVSFSRSIFDFWKLSTAFWQIRSLVRDGDYDLIHVHTPVASWLTRAAIATLKTKSKLVYTAHGFHFQTEKPTLSSLLYLMLERVMAKQSDYLITINNHDFELAKKYKLAKAESHIYLIHGIGIDPAAYQVNKESTTYLSQEFTKRGIDVSSRKVLCISYLNSNKNLYYLIDEFQSYQAKHGDAHLILVGYGPLEAALKRHAKDAGLERSVHLLGYRSDIPHLLALADVLVLCSKREGLPRSIMEAMSASLPVIASDIRGSRDLLEEGCGFLFKPQVAGALSVELEKALTKNVEISSLTERAYKKILTQYSFEVVLKEVMKVYAHANKQSVE